VFRKFLTTNTDYFYKHDLPTGLWNDQEQSACLWSRNWSSVQLSRTLVFGQYIHQQDQEKLKVEESFTLFHLLKNTYFDIFYLKACRFKYYFVLITHPEGRS